jgi:hypothetical protein
VTFTPRPTRVKGGGRRHPVTAVVRLERLAAEDERELVRLDRVAALMRQVPAQLGPPVAPALHVMARGTITERETSS